MVIEWLILLFELRADGTRDQLPPRFYEDVVQLFATGELTRNFISKLWWRARPRGPRSRYRSRPVLVPAAIWPWIEEAWSKKPEGAGVRICSRQSEDGCTMVFWRYEEVRLISRGDDLQERRREPVRVHLARRPARVV